VLERRAVADAFRAIGLGRREALWAVRGLNRSGDKDDLELFRHVSLREQEPDANLPPMPLGEHVVEDYRDLAARGVMSCADISALAAASPRMRGPLVRTAGLVLVRQRPGSAKGVVFMTLEDETGASNVVVWPKVFEAQRALVIGARLVAVTGRLQSEHGVTHVVAERLEDLSCLLASLSARGADLIALARADEVRRPQGRDPREKAARAVAAVMPKGRNFH